MIWLVTMQLGNKDEAMKNYLAALHIYEEVSGKKSPSYVSTLANLGELKMLSILCSNFALTSTPNALHFIFLSPHL